MDEVPIEAAAGEHVEVDRCPSCAGIFLEFFDGEPSALSRGLRAATTPSGRPSVSGPLRCPDCIQPMVRRAYLGHGPELARCEGCLAIFLTPAEASELARLELPPEPPQPEPSWLERLLGWLPRR
jgi:hypothetical protein